MAPVPAVLVASFALAIVVGLGTMLFGPKDEKPGDLPNAQVPADGVTEARIPGWELLTTAEQDQYTAEYLRLKTEQDRQGLRDKTETIIRKRLEEQGEKKLDSRG